MRKGVVRRALLCGVTLMLTVFVAGCSLFGGGPPTAEQTPTFQNLPTRVGVLSPSIELISKQVLTNMHLHSYNPGAMSRGVRTGGLYINWKMDNPSVTNDVRPGPDGNPQHNHDPQVDLLYLTALVEYQQLHPSDTTYQSDVTHTLNLVIADFPDYSVPKGWIYFYLLNDGLMLKNNTLLNEAQNAAISFYTHWYNPTLGTVYDKLHNPGDYSVNHTLQCGAALIDAGIRWRQPAWVTAGKKTIDHTLAVAYDPTYHLFYNSMYIDSSGKDHVQNYQAKPSTQGEAIGSLVTAYNLTHDNHYIQAAGGVLQALFSSSIGLWDQQNGGFFFAYNMSTKELSSAYKETRSQSLVLIGLHQYNQVKSGQYAAQERQLVDVMTQHFYNATYHGYFYRVTPDFKVYVSRPGTGIGVEDYFTTEAMGSSVDALEKTEFVG